MEQILLHAIYETDVFMDEKERRNWFARLRRRGFKRSMCKEAYYHPDHWQCIGMGISHPDGTVDAGDFWIMNDAFKAKTETAKAWANQDEEDSQTT